MPFALRSSHSAILVQASNALFCRVASVLMTMQFPSKEYCQHNFSEQWGWFFTIVAWSKKLTFSHSIWNIGCRCWHSDPRADMLTKPCLLVGMLQHVDKCLATMSSKYVNQTVLLTCQQDVSQHVADILVDSFERKYTKAL